MARFQSILFEREVGADTRPDEPAYFADLNLDQVVAALTAGREQYDLEPFFYSPLRDVATVCYRHEVLRDLERPGLLEAVRAFAGAMAKVRQHLTAAEEGYYPLAKQGWFLKGAGIYCDAVESLAGALAAAGVSSRGFQGLRAYLAEYAASDRFAGLAAETKALERALAAIRYTVRIQGAKVTVGTYEGEPDYGTEVEATFARFRQGAVRSYLVRLPERGGMDHVEAQIAERVARLHPDVFRALAGFCARRRGFVDATIARFDREVQFYVAYLELVDRLRAAGLPFCYPRVSVRSKEVAAEETFDLALASKLVSEGREVVTNDFRLGGRERIFVVTGPNNGGKTTFARTFGQLHHLAGLGLLVPGTRARLFLADRIFTHFEREESVETLRGKLEDELVRVHAILEQASADSVIVMNESFSSTTLQDALFVGSEVMRRLLDLGCLGVYVTFVDELASLSEATVSMVAQIVPENPAERTFKLLRQPADGLAYAWAIADKYGLTYERLVERIGA
ncbi:MAG TPA: hypothetical protein VNJ46_03220 [Gaiellaceae bacterium]|nr:hypothetical protein [Gaiellaceae bacterium]